MDFSAKVLNFFHLMGNIAMLKNETLCSDFPTELKMCGCAKEEDGRLLYSNVAEFLMDSSTATSLTAECANRFRIH